jgi:hypothetical protein
MGKNKDITNTSKLRKLKTSRPTPQKNTKGSS